MNKFRSNPYSNKGKPEILLVQNMVKENVAQRLENHHIGAALELEKLGFSFADKFSIVFI